MKQEPIRDILTDVLKNVDEIERLAQVMRSKLIDELRSTATEWYTEDRAERMESFLATVCRQIDEVTEDTKAFGHILPAFSEAPSV